MSVRCLLAVLLIAVGTACGESPGVIRPTQPEYKPLTNRSDVLNNLQLAYNDRNIIQYEKILDNGFMFLPSDGDVRAGLPVQWDRTEEILLNVRLFATTKGPSDPWPLCTSINMDVQFEDGLQWDVVPATGETWYTTTVSYNFQIEVQPDTRFIAYSGAKAQFTVRNAGTGNAPEWQLVEGTT